MLRRSHSGKGLGQVLVVIVILLLIAGILLPGMQKVRETTPGQTCMNNLRQIGIAVNNYSSSYHDKLPPLVASGAVKNGSPYTGTIHFTLLPYMEQEALYRAGIGDTSTSGSYVTTVVANPYTPTGTVPSTSYKVTASVVKPYLCPSDGSANNGACGNQSPLGANQAGTSYSANYMLFGQVYNNIGFDGKPIVASTTGRPTGSHSALYKIGEIPDGVANTIMFTERLASIQTSYGSLWNYPNFDASEPGCVKSDFAPASQFNPFIAMGSVNGNVVGVFAPNNGWGGYALAPQIAIPKESFDPSRPGGAHPKSIMVVMGDASTRSVAQVSNETWSQALCPDDGKILGSDW